MICEAIYCAVILGGVTAHVTDDHAPEGGYEWFNNNIGVSLETKGKIYYGSSVVYFTDSFGEPSDTELVHIGYRLDDNFAIGGAVGRGKTSYYEGGVAAPFIEGCDKNICLNVTGTPNFGNNDPFFHVHFKVRF